MRFDPLPILGAWRISLERKGDARGFFARLFCADEFAAHGLDTDWVQMNTSFSAQSGTLRGFHFQRPPAAETKLVRCLQGAIFDVIVDLRTGSPGFGKWYGLELTAENRDMLYIPKGIAHGFQTLVPDTELLYFHSARYNPDHERGLRYDDPHLAIPWPRSVSELSTRDAAHPDLTQVEPICL
ncbi:dTDP-4-dehydrorhamnose 3,5-epimerase [uncultured Ruegeria sp.]|uniref:dTDP-4-dehydrorhamnose 3,5-epimerase n=1 Tax=uncultured Ruegeria sp. TaxID=259304 RepID=UPI002618F9C5|nr:dTDP-4-dehydrorhamnose 3,5-epimerase [uncultured Ruegeria sp.]